MHAPVRAVAAFIGIWAAAAVGSVIHLQGTVRVGELPVADARICLKKAYLCDTTDSAGKFIISSSGLQAFDQPRPSSYAIAYEPGRLRVELRKSSPVKAALFGLDGAMVSIIVDKQCRAGTHVFAFEAPAAGIYLLQAAIDQGASSFVFVNGARSRRLRRAVQANTTILGKSRLTVDSLIIERGDVGRRSFPVSKYIDEFDINLTEVFSRTGLVVTCDTAVHDCAIACDPFIYNALFISPEGDRAYVSGQSHDTAWVNVASGARQRLSIEVHCLSGGMQIRRNVLIDVLPGDSVYTVDLSQNEHIASLIDPAFWLDRIGMQHARMVFTRKKAGAQCVYAADFNYQGAALFPLVKPSEHAQKHAVNPMLSPDGKLVCYGILQGNEACGAYLQRFDSSNEPVLVDSAGTEPHWWIDADSVLHVVYSTRFFTSGDLQTSDGKTYRRKVTNTSAGIQVGPPQEIAPYPMNGGVSASGKYVCTGYAAAAFYDTDAGQLININEGMQVCNPSICPDPHRENFMAFLNFQGPQNLLNPFTDHPLYPANAWGSVGQHAVIFIVDHTNTVRNFLPAERHSIVQWQDPEWTNHPYYIAALAKDSDYAADAGLIDVRTREWLPITFKPDMEITSSPCIWFAKPWPPARPLVVTNPKGGETYQVGDTVRISWGAEAGRINDVGIRVSCENGGIEHEILAGSHALDGEYKWVVGDECAGKTRILVYDYADESVNDTSEPFTIVQ